jgi:hypothetical protein
LHPDEVCEKMIQVYLDVVEKDQRRYDYSQKLKEYSWDAIANQWKTAFEELL